MHGPLTLKNKILSTPLQQISKTSTPIRSRIVSSTLPINSTPISQLKNKIISNNEAKQNKNILNFADFKHSHLSDLKNSHLSQQEKPIKVFALSQNQNNTQYMNNIRSSNNNNNKNKNSTLSINLSPILTLNKRLQQAPFQKKVQNFRSLTPNYNKTYNSLEQSMRKEGSVKREQMENSLQSQNVLMIQREDNDVKENSRSISRSNKGSSNKNNSKGMRTSRSFSQLFSRQLQESEGEGFSRLKQLQRKNSPSLSSTFKQSLSGSTFKQSLSSSSFKQSLSSSSFKQSFANSNNYSGNINTKNMGHSGSSIGTIQREELLCANNHNKMAKYRLINPQQQTTPNNQLFYCSKCAIDLVQQGSTVQQLPPSSTQHQSISLHTSPRTLNLTPQSSLPDPRQIMQVTKKLKQSIIQQLSQIQQIKTHIQNQFLIEKQQIDCYYNSLIAYIEQQRHKDHQKLGQIKQEIQHKIIIERDLNTESELRDKLLVVEKIENPKYKGISKISMQQLQQLDKQLNSNPNYQTLPIQPCHRLITFPKSIQDQFDNFVSFIDTTGKLYYNTFMDLKNSHKTNREDSVKENKEKSYMNNKNSALRFSFEKALKQSKRTPLHSLLQLQELQQYSDEEEYVDENSFSHYNSNNAVYDGPYNNKEDHQQFDANNFIENLTHSDSNIMSQRFAQRNVEQKPFRTLFAQEDEILQDQQWETEQDKKKNNMHSPTFKSI